MKYHNRILTPVLASFALAASANAAVIVSADFGSLTPNNLNGTSADTFSSAITSAGGSATWLADTTFKTDGSTGPTNQKSASLNLGSYINDAKGTATGFFVLQVTTTQTVTTNSITNWISVGFATQNEPSTSAAFNQSGTTGVATMLYRANGDIDQFAGTGTGSPVAAADILYSGTRTLTITLDFTPDGGFNGTNNFGTLRFGADTGLDGAYQEFGTHLYTSASPSFGSILLSLQGGATSGNVSNTYSNLTLTQIPEPTTALLGGLGMLVLLRRRR